MANKTTISVNPEIRDEVRMLKRGQMTYDEVITEMIKQYDPEEAIGCV